MIRQAYSPPDVGARRYQGLGPGRRAGTRRRREDVGRKDHAADERLGRRVGGPPASRAIGFMSGELSTRVGKFPPKLEKVRIAASEFRFLQRSGLRNDQSVIREYRPAEDRVQEALRNRKRGVSSRSFTRYGQLFFFFFLSVLLLTWVVECERLERYGFVVFFFLCFFFTSRGGGGGGVGVEGGGGGGVGGGGVRYLSATSEGLSSVGPGLWVVVVSRVLAEGVGGAEGGRGGGGGGRGGGGVGWGGPGGEEGGGGGGRRVGGWGGGLGGCRSGAHVAGGEHPGPLQIEGFRRH